MFRTTSRSPSSTSTSRGAGAPRSQSSIRTGNPGLDRYWVPSVASSALFGTDLAEHWYAVDTGGDLAFLNGTMKALLDLPGGVAREFVERSTEGFADVEAALRDTSWEAIEQSSGVPRAEMERFAGLLCSRPKTILVWSMGLTQHRHGVDTVLALTNLGLMRGASGQGRGRPGADSRPLRSAGRRRGRLLAGVGHGDPRPLGRRLGLRAAARSRPGGHRADRGGGGRRGRRLVDRRRQLPRNGARPRPRRARAAPSRVPESTRMSC